MEKIAGIDHPTHSRLRRHEIPDADENLPIAYRLLQRFVDARTVLGNDWHSALIASDPFFTTEKGKCYLTSIGRSLSDLKTGPVDHMERVIVAMEKLAGIPVKSVV
ncbi:hypothetical protein [Dyadobacter sp. BHUBP1]|uniref:hypothetical protein n=1 Tax=Dyadobacter sp. BHUBP1 TaxID=3424178 RepID=UPI003D347D24